MTRLAWCEARYTCSAWPLGRAWPEMSHEGQSAAGTHFAEPAKMVVFFALLATLGAKLADCERRLCVLRRGEERWLVAVDSVTAVCGDPQESLDRLELGGEVDIGIYAFAQPPRARSLDALFRSRGFEPAVEAHAGGVERMRVRLDRGSVQSFFRALEALDGCVYGRSVLARDSAPRD